MSPRAHLGLRLAGLLVLLAVAAWPRSGAERQDRAALRVATGAHFAATTAARLHIDEAPRPRAARSGADDDAEVLAPSDQSVSN